MRTPDPRTLLPIALALVACAQTRAAEPSWTAIVRADDIVIGQDLQKLNPHRAWAWRFGAGEFEVAIRKTAVPVLAPQCRMDYLILKMPQYYPENPAQAPLAERRVVYDALMSIKKTGKGSLKIHFNALYYWHQEPAGPLLTTCNIFFVLPLEKDAAKIVQ